jgi:nitroreductase
MNPTLAPNPWTISADLFPADASSEEKLGFILNYAILAPSSHNTQPWRFRVHGNVLELHADLSRALPVVDPQHRELIMSCGAALFHVRVACQYFGHAFQLETFPDPNTPTFLARLVLGLHCETDADKVALFHAIPQRRTNRRAFRPDPVPPTLLAELQADAQREGAWLQAVLSDEARAAVAELIATADRVQWADRHFRHELAAWLRPNNHPGRDGIPGYAEGLTDFKSQVGPLVVRTFDLGKGQAAKDHDIALYSPALVVLGTDADTPADWLRAGQALATVLLRARSEDVWASFLNQPIEVPDLRPQLTEVIGRSGFPQLLLRLGYAVEVPPTPRRPLGQVLLRPQHGAIRLNAAAAAT